MGISAEQLKAFLILKEKTPPAEVVVFLDKVPEEAVREFGAALSGLSKPFADFGAALAASISDGLIQFRR